MNIEQQCTSLELSKRLKELGVRQDSYFHWVITEIGNQFIWPFELCEQEVSCIVFSWSAFTASELGEMLPKQIWHPNGEKLMICRPANRLCHWVVYYDKDTWTEENSEANARAAMLINLIEQGMVKV